MGIGLDRETERLVTRLARIGRARAFSPARFRRALATVRGISRPELLRRLLTEWTGLSVGEDDVEAIWRDIERVHASLRECLGTPTSLLTGLLHELHSRRGLICEPRFLPERDLHALRVNAITDPLTGLYNRRFLLEHLDRELSRAERSGGVVSVVLMDLRGFKRINDRLGHPVGDSVLVGTARRIRESLRVVDAGCRYGGDEFMAVLPNADLVDSLMVAERIRKRVSSLRLPVGGGLRVGLNYGIATYPTDGRTPSFIVKVSDVRLYDSKPREDESTPKRRYPRFLVQGLTLNVHGRHGRLSAGVQDISYGGLSFTHPDDHLPPRLEGEIRQQFSPEAHAVKVRPVSAVPLRPGRVRIGCAFEH